MSWVDDTLSAELPVLRAKGEGQILEYIVAFPTNAREMGKEIAAFATSGGGMIILGVSDEGDLRGLSDATDQQARDVLLQRLQGVCHGTVKPPVTPAVRFAIEDEKVVLVVEVPNGDQPVYYANNVPYLRHITQSRPADPAEVIQLVAAWLADHPDVDDPLSSTAQAIAEHLSDVVTYHADISQRLDAGLSEYVRVAYRVKSELFRHWAAEDLAVAQGWQDDLYALAAALDALVRVRPQLGSTYAEEIQLASQTAAAAALKFLHTRLSRISTSLARQLEALTAIRQALRETVDSAKRFDEIVERDGLSELKTDLAYKGRLIAAKRAFTLRDLNSAWRGDLDTLAMRLHGTELLPVEYGDGGLSINQLKQHATECAECAADVIAQMQQQ